MSDQLVFDLAAGRVARDEALEHVDNPPWRVFADRAVLTIAKSQRFVTSDDVWAQLDRDGIPRPAEGRAMGPVMMGAVREHILTPDHFASGTNPKHHADVMRVYRSLVL